MNVYECVISDDVKVLTFPEVSDEWLDFVVDCWRGKEHVYDVVEGPMADDTIWNYVDDFAHGDISREAFWSLIKFKYPTHQIVFCTDKALGCLRFVDSYRL